MGENGESLQAYSRWEEFDEANGDLEISYPPPRKSTCSRLFEGRKGFCVKCLLLLVAFIAGFFIGYAIQRHLHYNTVPHHSGGTCGDTYWDHYYKPELSEKLRGFVSTKGLDNSLRYFTNTPHPAGSSPDIVQATYIESKFSNARLFDIQKLKYRVKLSRPDRWSTRSSGALGVLLYEIPAVARTNQERSLAAKAFWLPGDGNPIRNAA
ncbi:PREDICTED: uncharacterized protein LOC106806157 [Priapulus caudatus]|uniref:Uncharacterized protein LOC106806157 n=1 Tax=Priapulus caudatus TaxID=37621 RepID=A0ABM1DU83_PRICU|nr:PREDICTED: uncharacterized protein LOC106806157 [Priapulus caudatus]